MWHTARSGTFAALLSAMLLAGCGEQDTADQAAHGSGSTQQPVIVEEGFVEPVSGEYKIVLKTSGFPDGTQVSIFQLAPATSVEAVFYPHPEAPLVSPKMEFNGLLDEPLTATFNVVPPGGSGVPYQRFNVMLEPGSTTVSLDAEGKIDIVGGRFNNLVINSWRRDQNYLTAARNHKNAKKALSTWRNANPEAENLPQELMSKLNETAKAEGRIKDDLVAQARKEVKDPYVSLALLGQNRGMDASAKLAGIMQLEASLKYSTEWQKNYGRAMKAVKALEAQSTIGVGTIIKDFEAKNFNGSTFNLSDLLGTRKYILVEFWASWCGPCRVEIPHMKEAYSHYADKGFEILSFSLDHEADAWEDASIEEQLPWLNTGDLLAYTSPVVKMYGVVGIPRNYLIDGETGEIIAMDLRGKALDAKLVELLG